jgi:type IV pilus assembly protein PilA
MVIGSKDKGSVSEYFISVGTMPADSDIAGVSTVTGQSTYISAITYSTAAGVASITYTLDNLSSVADTTTIVFAGSGNDTTGVQWTCSTGTLVGKYLPANCR